jgi:hypothetical protein
MYWLLSELARAAPTEPETTVIVENSVILTSYGEFASLYPATATAPEARAAPTTVPTKSFLFILISLAIDTTSAENVEARMP